MKQIEHIFSNPSKEIENHNVSAPLPQIGAGDHDRLERVENMVEGMQADVREIHSVKFAVEKMQSEVIKLMREQMADVLNEFGEIKDLILTGKVDPLDGPPELEGDQQD